MRVGHTALPGRTSTDDDVCMTGTVLLDHLRLAMAAHDLPMTFAGLERAHDDVRGNPERVVACLLPEADAALSNVDLNPIDDGAVLPILHRQGEPDARLTLQLYGMGHRPVEVGGGDLADGGAWLAADLAAAVNWVLDEIVALQEQARAKHDDSRPRWPIIVMHTPDAWDAI